MVRKKTILNQKEKFILLLLIIFFIYNLNFVFANTYINDIYFTVPETVYITNERIELKGYVYQANYSSNGIIVSNSSAIANALVNFTITDTNWSYVSNYTFTTDSSGAFYSRSNYFTNTTIPQINAPSTAGIYYIRAEYLDPNTNISFSQFGISVINQSVDLLSVSAGKAVYNPSESMIIRIEAIKRLGDRIIFTSNVSVNGSLRNSTKNILRNFSCTTATNGKCTANLTVPSAHGDYILELGNFKAFSSFSIIPFSYNLYIKDDLGKSMKNVFGTNEQGMVEVKINNASDSDSYSVSGYIADSSGNTVSSQQGGVISSSVLNTTNYFRNTFLFGITNPGTYSVHLTVSKTGDGSITSLASFQVQDWILGVDKKEINSGFEYEYSVFTNKTLNFQALPTYRSNGSVIPNISSTFFSISLRDNLNNIISSTNASWNSSCGKSGCYEFSLTSPTNSGQYTLLISLNHSIGSNSETQTVTKIINVINGIMSVESTDKDGNIKELFGTNEYAYLSLISYNLTSSAINLSDAEIFIVSYMNGSEFSYNQANNFNLVNSSNNISEWAWNSTLQRIKLDVPKIGGVYTVFLYGNNRTLGAIAKFIVNPYDMCSVPKTGAGQTGSAYSTYYAWQFKTTDTIYFEIKIIQANNPLGRAAALNITGMSASNGSAYGSGSACVLNTQTQQVVSNATITITEAKNLESGALQSMNATESTCQSSDNNGTYSCTVKPLTKWEGGQSIVKFNVKGQDGTSSVFYSRFEARAFYLYGWSNTWQNNPSSNITLNLYLYEAGNSWWSGSGGNGINGKVEVKKVEYQGRDGEWLWPPVDSGYNVSNLNTSTLSGSINSISLPASNMPGNVWKTGYYRVVLKATRTLAGGTEETDYGYAWFGIKLWDVYGYPIECTTSSCSYKSYFNSKENITLYVTISKAGDSWWSYNYNGGQDIYGNVSVGIKKIQNCRTWPCKELNSSQYTATTINVNSSSPNYWASGLNSSSANKYIIQINSTVGTWGTGYYSITLDVNGTDTGYAWFNTIAFYISTQPTDSNGTRYKYTIRGNELMYFNVSSTKNYKWNYYGTNAYNISDYVNTTIDDIVLRIWDSQTYQTREYNYPEILNVTSLSINGNALVNLSFLNGSWPSGYYWGELILKNIDNETSTGWLWFEVRPFRVSIYSNSYNIDSDQCVNATLNVYDADWNSWALLSGNYSVTSITENIWSYNTYSTTSYSNYSINGSNNNRSSFNGTTTLSVCPNSGQWGGGSWGGYHYLNVNVKDNAQNDTQTGWLYFRTIPFTVSWGSVSGGVRTNANINTSVTLRKPSTNALTSGNLTRLYQWRYDGYYSRTEEYNFSVGNSTTGICYSNVSRQCTVNGTQTITIYPPSSGWKVGWNYIQAEWISVSGLTRVEDWSGISFDGREVYNGWFDTYWYDGSNYVWKYYIAVNENITIKLVVRDANYNSVDVNITSVQYAYSGTNCWSDWCRSYTSATYSPTNTSGGSAILRIQVPSSNWSRGYYAIKAIVSDGSTSATITGGTVRVKDFTAPNITISAPLNNQTYNASSNSSLAFSAATSEDATCYLTIVNYDNFYNWYCYGWNSTNSSNSSSSSSQLESACNYTKYNYNGSNYFYEYVYSSWRYRYNGSTWSYPSGYLTTGGRSHSATINISDWPTQHYGLSLWCYDEDWNYVSLLRAFKVTGINSTSNATQNTTNLSSVNILSPVNAAYYSTSSITFNFSINANGSCLHTLNNGITNSTMTANTSRTGFNATNLSIADGNYSVYAYCNDTSGNWNRTVYSNFIIDTTFPQISYAGGTANNSLSANQTWIYVNVSATETNFANITFKLFNVTNSLINSTIYTTRTYFINWTSLGYSNYSYNVSIYDLAGNFNSTAIRYINLSALAT